MSTAPVTVLIGNITRAPELRFTTGGTALCQFSVAHNPRRKDADGKWVDGNPEYFDCVAWGDLASNLAASLEQGTRFVGVATPQYRTWEDKETKAKRSKVDFRIEDGGPSCRWATTVVTKVQSAGVGAPKPTASSDGYPFDEEPF